MILDDKNFEVTNSLNTNSHSFEIEESSKMFDLLSNKVYEDPIRAVIRELSCNAIDANIDANNEDNIKIYLPTEAELTLAIEDTGIGMTHEDVMTVYRSYGKSTKSSSNKVIGALGIGGKTPLAYTNQFTLVTSKNGKQNSYIIYKDENGIPKVTLINTIDSEISGTKVELVIRKDDISKFYDAAVKTFIFFNRMPLLMRGKNEFYEHLMHGYKSYNTKTIKEMQNEWNEARELLKKDYYFTNPNRIISKVLENYNSICGVIMGQIYYNVNQKLLEDLKYKESSSNMFKFPVLNSYGAIKIKHVPLGSISFQSSREAINYNKSTIENLQKVFYSDFENYKTQILKYDAKTFCEQFNKIENSSLISRITDNLNDKELEEFYEKIISYIFNTIYNKSVLYEIKCRDTRVFDVCNLKSKFTNNLDKISEKIVKNLYNDMFIHKDLVNIIVANEKIILEKLERFEQKNKEKRNKDWFTSPIIIKNKLKLLKDNLKVLIVKTKKDAKDIYNLCPSLFTIVESSTLLVKKENNKKLSIRGSSPKIYDFKNKVYITEEDALKLKNVTYECFEGDVSYRGLWFTPNFDYIKSGGKLNRSVSFNINQSGLMRDANYNKINRYASLYNQLNNAIGKVKYQTSNKHFLIDWNFFKKNNIWENENWHYIDDYYSIEIKNNSQEILDLFSTSNMKGKSFFDKFIFGYENSLYNEGKLTDQKFQNTIFGKECKRRIAELKCNITEPIKLLQKLNYVYNELKEFPVSSLGLKSLKDSLYEIKMKLNDNKMKVVDYETPLYEIYPMLKFINCSPDSEDNKKIINYILDIGK